MKVTKRGFIFDVHHPWHDVKAVNCAMDILEDFRPDEIVFSEFHDCYSVSRFNKDPNRNFRLLNDEVSPGIDLRDEIVRRSRARRVSFCEGNHEARVGIYMQENAPLLSPSISVKSELGIPAKWNYVPYGQQNFIKLDQLTVTHGFWYNKYAAQKHLEELKVPCLLGHTHRIQVASSRHLNDGTIMAYNIGWLGDPLKAAPYCKVPPDWKHAIALGWFAASYFIIHIIPIENGRAINNGKIYKTSG
jgi:predicted phosphodiesterase